MHSTVNDKIWEGIGPARVNLNALNINLPEHLLLMILVVSHARFMQRNGSEVYKITWAEALL